MGNKRFKKINFWRYPVFILLTVLIMGGFVFLSDNEGINDREDVNLIDDDPLLGDKNAPVTIIEFSDYQCPFCRKFWTESFNELKEEYIDSGKVKFVYRDFPLDGHPSAEISAIAANCVREIGGDSAYFKMHDKIFSEQNKLDREIVAGVGFNTDDLQRWAGELSYNIKDCLDSGKYISEVQKDFNDGMSFGVDGTPTFYINGKVLSGTQPYPVFKQIIEGEL